MAISIIDLDAGVDLSSARRRARNERLELIIPATIFTIIFVACFLGPAIFHIVGPNGGSLLQAMKPVGAAGHLLGTDPLGNDVLSRCLFGGRTSIEVGFGAVGIGIAAGALLGIVGGYLGGLVDGLIMRVLDIFLAFPSIILAMVVATYLGPSEQHLILALAFFTVPANARIARAATLKLRSSEYLVAARFAGRSKVQVLRDHVVVNAVQPLITFGLLGVGTVMLVEAALSYLGFGIPPPKPSWGESISTGQNYLASDPSLVLLPAAFLFVTVTSINLLGDALRSRWSTT